MRVALNHRTQYRYDKAVFLGPQVIQLRPAPHCRTPILSYSLSVTPAHHLLNWQLDPHHNHLARLLFPDRTNDFVVEVDLVAELSPLNPFDFFLEPGVEDYPFEYAPGLAKDLEPYRSLDPAGPLLQAFLQGISGEKRGTVGFLVDLNRRVRDEIGYLTRLDPGVQTSEQTLEKRTGSCRDSAWLLVQILRHLGIAARFVSGYLIQLAAEEGTIEGPGAPQTDSADLHAWAEAFLPGAGWIGFDPTSGLFAGEGHIPLVCTPNASQAAPIGGSVEPANVDFSYSMSIRRLNDPPRPSKPFTEEDWVQVEELAHNVDADLKAQDVRLTMGSEPTFVGVDEPESPQWNIDALGPMKRSRSLALIQSLRERVAPGAMLHYGQGKWYPGELLPRWALSCYWRSDCVPVWENIALIARQDQDYGFGVADALSFMEALTRRLQVSPENALPAYNDYMIKSKLTEATTVLDASRAAVMDVYATNGGIFPSASSPPVIVQSVASNAHYVTAVKYNVSGSSAAVILKLGNTGAAQVDGTYIGMFGTAQSDGTVNWTCATANNANAAAYGSGVAVPAMYPFLPAACQN